MNREQERAMFRYLADPIKHYMMENGIDELNAGLMAGSIAQRQLTNLQTHVEIVPKAKDES